MLIILFHVVVDIDVDVDGALNTKDDISDIWDISDISYILDISDISSFMLMLNVDVDLDAYDEFCRCWQYFKKVSLQMRVLVSQAQKYSNVTTVLNCSWGQD